MAITREKRVIHQGVPGIATTTIRLVSRDEATKMRGAAAPIEELPVGEILRQSSDHMEFLNPYTGEIEVFTHASLTETFAGIDLDSTFLSIQVTFKPDRPSGQSRTLDEVVADLRRMGAPEDKIQEVIRSSQSKQGGGKP